ncbi:MAG: tetratricopeptide repeat protein [Planctomycetes bacterium]|nr:tetratricopeptide repeat protein [Planctomycetota bacterium]MBL7144881.1 tetratricopeptide repeat protein [Phycisphaerae bacterium]
MTDSKGPVIIRNFMKKLSRGAIESIPLGGALLEQVIRRTLTGEASKEETAKLHTALLGVWDKLKGQDVRFVDIIGELEKEVTLRKEVRVEMGKIVALLEDPENAVISERLASAVEHMDVSGMFVHNLPYPSIGKLFKGRENVVEKLRYELEAGRALTITQAEEVYKAGGVGKTRLAVEYGWRALEAGRYWGVFFVLADAQGSLNKHLAGLADEHLLNLPEHNIPEQPVIIEAVLRELEKHTDWLLILDNVDSKDMAKRLSEEVLSRLAGGHVLITSCWPDWSDEIANLQINGLNEVDAAAYLLERTESERKMLGDDAGFSGEVAHKLGGYPVALEQAACYINRCRIGFGDFLEDFNKSGKKGLSLRRGDLINNPPAVLATFETIEKLLGPGEYSILRLACFFSPEPIPVALFEAQAERISKAAWLLPREMRAEFKSGGRKGKLNVRDLLSELAKWSLITLTDDDFNIHKVVQECIISGIKKDKRNAWIEIALHLMNGYICNAPRPDDVRSWFVWNRVESHVRVLVSLADDFDISEPTTLLMNELGLYLKSRGRFSEAELLYLWALEVDEKTFGSEHPNVAVRLNNLAQLLERTNRFEQAEFLMQRALEIDEKWFGPEHPKVAVRLNNLAELLRATNQLGQAEPLLRMVIEILDRNGGERLENYSAALNNLAQLLKTTNRLEQAEPLMRRALEIDEKTLGAYHPKVSVRLNNLAQLLKELNRLKEAEPLMRLSLVIDEKTFGPDHPQISVGLNNLGQLLKKMNRLREAEPLMRRALEIDEKSFGPNHPVVAVRLNNLAQLLHATKHFGEAEFLMRRALDIDEKMSGPEHPKVAIRLNNLAGLLESTNRLEQAEPLMRRAVKILENHEGKPAGSYAAALNNLANLLKATNRLEEAELLMRCALEIDEGLFGPSHPNVAVDLNNLAQLLKETKRIRKARALMRRALQILEDSLGPEHPKSKVVQRNLESLK